MDVRGLTIMEKFIFANKHTWDRLTKWERDLVGYVYTKAQRKAKKVQTQNRRKGRG